MMRSAIIPSRLRIAITSLKRERRRTTMKRQTVRTRRKKLQVMMMTIIRNDDTM